MNKLERGDLVKTAVDVSTVPAAAVRATLGVVAAAAIQYWHAYHDQSLGVAIKADANHVWVHWFGMRSDQGIHKYHNKTEYFKLVSRTT